MSSSIILIKYMNIQELGKTQIHTVCKALRNKQLGDIRGPGIDFRCVRHEVQTLVLSVLGWAVDLKETARIGSGPSKTQGFEGTRTPPRDTLGLLSHLRFEGGPGVGARGGLTAF